MPESAAREKTAISIILLWMGMNLFYSLFYTLFKNRICFHLLSAEKPAGPGKQSNLPTPLQGVKLSQNPQFFKFRGNIAPLNPLLYGKNMHSGIYYVFSIIR